jgi:hypothetical protein
MYICNIWYVLCLLVDCRPAVSQLNRSTRTSCCIYTLLPPADGQLAGSTHVEV